MNRSESIAALAKALAEAQGELEGAVKDKVNPAFRSRYADLGAVYEAIRGPFAKHGLAVVQALRSTDHGVACETMLIHTTGEYISEVFEVPVMKRDAHGYGSASTYSRRYSLMAMAGIAPIDDDGNDSVGNVPVRQDAVDPWTPEMIQQARIAANIGISVYQDWWKNQTAEFRAQATNTERHKQFKTMANRVTDEKVPL